MANRLDAYRAQQAGSYNNQPAGGGNGGAYTPRRDNPYAAQDSQYEMNQLPARNGGGDDTTAFYAEIGGIQDGIKRLNENVAQIGDLQTRLLNSADGSAGAESPALERLVGDTSALSAQLKRRIAALFDRPAGQQQAQQAALVKSRFVEALQNYQTVEQQHRTKVKQRIERQYKIVKPDASPDEVRAVVNDEGGGQVFSQALMNSNRYGEGRAAYREVQERHADIKKIEKTLTELAQLFQDMSFLVEKQDNQVTAIRDTAAVIDTDVQAGHDHTVKAVDSAAGARRKRWICFWIIVLIIIVVVLVVLFTVKPWTLGKNKK